MEESVEAGETDWAKLLGSLEVARLELENIFASVALLEIATDRLDMDRFKQLTRRAERALLTRYDSKSDYAETRGFTDKIRDPPAS